MNEYETIRTGKQLLHGRSLRCDVVKLRDHSAAQVLFVEDGRDVTYCEFTIYVAGMTACQLTQSRLSAVAEACSVAAHLESLPEHQLRPHLRSAGINCVEAC